MENHNQSIEDLRTIRRIMEESTRFLSLSGLSGICAGVVAIAGALAGNLVAKVHTGQSLNALMSGSKAEIASPAFLQLIVIAAAVLILAVLSSLYLSIRKARKAGINAWSPVSKRMLASLLIPLASGGLFITILAINGMLQLVIPGMLIFYGLALVSASKFTYDEVFYLGIAELAVGFITAFIPGLAVAAWIIGFGVMHIVYGIALYRKYDV